VNRRSLVASLGALLFSAGAAVGLSRLAPKQPQKTGPGRFVSLTPAITETVVALGAVTQLIGVSNYCKLPRGLELPRLGSSLTPSFEAIAGLRPSLILSDGSAAAKHEELSAIAKCEVLPWLTLKEVVESVRRLGGILNQQLAGDNLSQKLETRLAHEAPPDAPRVLLLLGYAPDRPAELWFIRRNSLHGAALSSAGARNAVAHDVAGLPRLSVEELLGIDPDQVLIMPSPGSTLEQRRQMLKAFSALAPLRAVKESRIGVLNDRATQSLGPSILDLVDSLAEMLKKMSGPRPIDGVVE
jgi:iron complex transport system substrate-binding protein